VLFRSDVSSDGWITAVATKYRLFLLIFIDETSSIQFRYSDVAALNSTGIDDIPGCLYPTDPGYNATNCQIQYDALKINNASYTPTISDLGTVRDSCFYGENDEYVAVAVARPQGVPVGYGGVYVFDRDTKEQIYYYPGDAVPQISTHPEYYIHYYDINNYLIPAAVQVEQASNGDLLVFSSSGNIIRMGTEGEVMPPAVGGLINIIINY
jgi:hypothetical protein